MKEIIFNGFPEKISALLLGITVWNTDLLSSEMKENFQNSGLTHILVVSGSNIAFVILILEFFIKYFPIRKIGKYIIIFWFLFLYGSLVGWETPVVRATFMGIISYISITEWWKINSVNILLLIAWIFCLFEPLYLLYDASFWLSFWATLWIILFQKNIYDFLWKYIFLNPINTVISVTLSASLWSLPALIFHFWNISFLGIFANILIGWLLWILLFLSVFYIFLWNFAHYSILYFLWIPIYYIGEFIFFIAEFFGKFPLYTVSDNIKIPLCITLCFAGFLYIISYQEKKILQTNKVIGS